MTVKWSAFPSGSAIAGSDISVGLQGGANVQWTWSQVATYIAGASGLTIGTSTITGGTTTRILYDNAGVLGEYTISGSGTVVAMATGATLTTAVAAGTWTASGTWTLPAHTLGGTVSGGGQQLNNIIIGTSTPLAGSFTILAASTSTTVTSASAVALTVGLNGATNPAFTIDSSTASQAAGLKITGAATGGTVALVATDSGSNANLTLNAKGSGTIGIGSVSTGTVTITPATTITGALTVNGATSSTFASGTITTSQPLTLTQTWNAGGVVFVGGLQNITATAAAALSLAQNYQIGGASRFALGYVGTNGTTPTIWMGATPATGNYVAQFDGTNLLLQPGSATSSGTIHLAPNGAGNWGLMAIYSNGSQIRMGATASFGFSNGATTGALDTIFVRDAANIWGQRNDTTAQIFRIYEDSESSNTIYSRAFIDAGKSTAGVLIIGTETAGTTTSGTDLTKLQFNVAATNRGDYAVTNAAAWTLAAKLFCQDVQMATAKLLSIASGSNQRAGNLTLVGGTLTVNNTTVTTNTVVLLTRKTSGGTIGTAITYTVSAGNSFTVNSDNILDTSTFSYFLIEVP